MEQQVLEFMKYQLSVNATLVRMLDLLMECATIDDFYTETVMQIKGLIVDMKRNNDELQKLLQ